MPLDASSCPLCDIPIPQREIEQAQFSPDGQKFCDKCQKLSPVDSKNCQFCDKPFPLPVMVGQAVPPKLKPALSSQICSSCDRRKRSYFEVSFLLSGSFCCQSNFLFLGSLMLTFSLLLSGCFLLTVPL